MKTFILKMRLFCFLDFVGGLYCYDMALICSGLKLYEEVEAFCTQKMRRMSFLTRAKKNDKINKIRNALQFWRNIVGMSDSERKEREVPLCYTSHNSLNFTVH